MKIKDRVIDLGTLVAGTVSRIGKDYLYIKWDSGTDSSFDLSKEQNKNYVDKFIKPIDHFRKAQENNAITKEMRDWFNERTNRHINLVKKYCAEISELNDSRFEGIEDRAVIHDASKFTEPEKTPYIYVSWDYKCKDDGIEFSVSDDIKEKMNKATESHVKNNRHHPEFHSTEKVDLINREDRDKAPKEIVDATKMSDLDIAEMVTDWLAMSEERNTNPKDWADKNIGVRWDFNEQQSKLIYELIDTIWEDTECKKCLTGKRVFIVHGWGGNPKEAWLSWLNKELTLRGADVHALTMPDTENPKIDTWVPYLTKKVGEADEDTYFVGHSLGGQTIMRYLESIKSKVGGIILVASSFSLKPRSLESEEEEEIAKSWFETKIDLEKVKQNVNKMTAIFSDDDPYAPLKDSKIFKDKLGAKIVIEKNKGHFTESDVKDLPVALKELLSLMELKEKKSWLIESKVDKIKVLEIANEIKKNYPDPKFGDCIPATNELHKKLDEAGISNKIIEGYFTHDGDEIAGWESNKEEHSWIEIDNQILDITVEMWNDVLYNKMPAIYFGSYTEQYEKEKAIKSNLIKQAYIVTEETIQKLICDSLQCYMTGEHPEIQIERPVKIEKELANDLLEGWAIGKEGQQKFKIDFIVHLNTYISDLPKVEVNRIAKLTEAQSDISEEIIIAFKKYKELEQKYSESLSYGPAGETTIEKRGLRGAVTKAFRKLRQLIKEEYKTDSENEVLKVIHRLQEKYSKLTEAQTDTAVVIMGWEKYKKSHPIEEDRIRRIIDEFIVIKEDYDYWDKKVRKILKDYGIYFSSEEKESWLIKNKTAPTYPEHKVDPKFSPFIQERYDDAVSNIRRLLKKEIKPIADETKGRYRVVISDNNKMFYFRDDRPDDPVPTGKWMDWVEKHWKISEEEYYKLPREERATMEAKEQLDKWVEKEYEEAWLEIYSPKEYDKLWWEERKKLPEEARYNLNHPAWQKLVKDVFKKEVEKVEKKMKQSWLLEGNTRSTMTRNHVENNSKWLLSSDTNDIDKMMEKTRRELKKIKLADFKEVPWEKFYEYVKVLKQIHEPIYRGEQAMERLDDKRSKLHDEIAEIIIKENDLLKKTKADKDSLMYDIKRIIEFEAGRELKKMSWLIDVAATIKKKLGKEFFKRIEKGYIGKYGINDHHATTHHWDLRLEMPEGELETYYKKRDMKNPPTDIKSSYVSFAIGKHAFPTGDKKFMIVRTEDHPLKYMEGNVGQKFTIPEGEYGAGYYFLYDKGKYQVLDIDSKRIVIYISGKKEEGAYALVHSLRKEGNEFLFIKLKEQNKEKLEEEYGVEIKI